MFRGNVLLQIFFILWIQSDTLETICRKKWHQRWNDLLWKNDTLKRFTRKSDTLKRLPKKVTPWNDFLEKVTPWNDYPKKWYLTCIVLLKSWYDLQAVWIILSVGFFYVKTAKIPLLTCWCKIWKMNARSTYSLKLMLLTVVWLWYNEIKTQEKHKLEG